MCGDWNRSGRKGRKRRTPFSLDPIHPFVLESLGRADILAHRVCRPGFSASASEKTAAPPAKRIEFCELYKSIHSHLLRPRWTTLEFLSFLSCVPINEDDDYDDDDDDSFLRNASRGMFPISRFSPMRQWSAPLLLSYSSSSSSSCETDGRMEIFNIEDKQFPWSTSLKKKRKTFILTDILRRLFSYLDNKNEARFSKNNFEHLESRNRFSSIISVIF